MTHKNKVSIIFLGCLCMLIWLGCGAPKNASEKNSVPVKSETPQPPKQAQALVDIPKLANKPPEEFEKNLGKSVSITKITGTPEQMPGEFRHYKLPALEDTLQVRFYKGKAVAFVLTLPKEKEVKTAAELASLGGIEVGSLSVQNPSSYATKWNGQAGGIDFSEIIALKSKTNDYYNLTVKIQ